MAFDSTAGLLFKIGADSEEAKENIARFRQLLGKDLGAMKEEFHEFSHEVLGSLQTVSGAVTAGVAVIGAAVVASAAFAVESAHKFVEYAEQVEKGSLRTGIAAEDMSGLIFAGKAMGVEYDSLVGGLTKFSSYIVKSASDTGYQTSAFKKLGISQEEVKEGIEHELPLLAKTQDAMHGLSSQVQRVAIVRELMGKGGAAMVQLMQLDSEAMKMLTDRAKELGLVLSEDDTKAAKAFGMALAELKAEKEALETSIGRQTLPLLAGWNIGLIAVMDTIRGGYYDMQSFFTAFFVNVDRAADRFNRLIESATKEGNKGLLPGAGDGVAKATADFNGLSNVIESLRMKTAGAGDELTKAVAEIQHMQLEAARAQEHFEKLKKAGTLDAATIKREAEALAKLPAGITALTLSLQKKINENILIAGDELRLELNAQREKSLAEELAAWELKMSKRKDQLHKEGKLTADNLLLLEALQRAGTKKINDDHAEAVMGAAEDLQIRLNAQQEKGWKEEQGAFALELEKLKIHLTKKGLLTAENQALLAEVEKLGMAKRVKSQQEAWGQELLSLQASLAALVSARLTTQERIVFTYDGEVAKFSAAEEAKKLKLAATEAEMAGIRSLFQMNRDALYTREQNELQALRNSQGWQGVFGGEFARLLRGDEAAAREWAESLNQSLLMVKLGLIGAKQMGEDAFGSFSKGMAGNISQAIVYSGSIQQAMRTAAASALASLSAESLTQAIYATALGFLRLAQYDATGASAAFQAAALFGSIGIAAAVAGRAVAPAQAGAGAGAGAAGGAGAASATGGVSVTPTNSLPASTDRSRVQIIIHGSVYGLSGVEQLASMLNDAVAHRDVRLIATQVKQATRVTV